MILIENEFWNAVVVLFGCCVFVAAILRGIYFHIKSGQVVGPYEEEYRDKGNRSCTMGCAFGAIFLVVNIGGILLMTGPILFLGVNKERDRKEKEAAVDINPLTQGPVSILAKEKPMLYEHYCELGRVIDSIEALRREEEAARANMSNREARNRLSKNIAGYKAALKRYGELRKNVETQAGYLYFARFFSNLGRRFNEEDLLKDLSKTEQELKQELLNRPTK